MKMQENKVFDQIADTYDEDFSDTIIGRAQRNIVQQYLLHRISEGCSVLEVNCGTGVDAFFLSAHYCKVLATDASEKMISVCNEKTAQNKGTVHPEFRVLAFNELAVLQNEKKSDLIFSNFSGLNCVSDIEMSELSAIFHSLLKPGGSLIAVLFGKECIWEKLYMFLKGRFKEVNRRMSDSQVKPPNDGELRIYYYSPKELKNFFSRYFDFIDVKPIGIFIPPSYLDPFFQRNKFLFKTLEMLERLSGRFSFLSDIADHYIIEFKAR